MATQQDYQNGTKALEAVVEAAIKANVPAFFQNDVPPALVSQISIEGAKAVIDAVDAGRAKQAQPKES